VADKVHIKVKQGTISTPKKAGTGQVTNFKGEDGALYEVWGEAGDKYIRENPEFDAEYEQSDTKGNDGTVYHHNKVVQIYDKDGKPLLKKGVSGYGGGRSYGKSPEEAALDRQSTEAIAAFNGLLNIYTSVVKAEISFSSGTSNTFDKAIRIAFAWGISRLEGALPAKLTAPPPGVPPQKPGESPKSESTKPASKEAKTLEELQAMEFANLGEFYDICHKQFGLTKSKTDAESSGFDLSVQAQRHMAWLNIVENYGVKPPA